MATLAAEGANGPDSPTAKAEALPLSLCVTYGVGTVAVSILLNTVTTYFPALMSTVLGQSPALAGLLLTFSKLYDIFVDLFVGHRIDKTKERMRRRRRYMVIGAIISAVSFYLIFNPPVDDGPWLVFTMAAILVLYSTGYSFFAVPYIAIAPDIARSYDGRTKLMSYRTFFGAVGQMIALAGAAALIKLGEDGAAGYRIMGGVLALTIFIAKIATVFGTSGVADSTQAIIPDKPGFTESVRQIWGNKPAVLLTTAKILQYISLAVNISTGLLFKLNVLKIGYEGQIQLSVAQNIAMGLCMPIWLMAGRRFGKRACYLAAISLYALTMLSWLLADSSITTLGLVTRGVLQGVGAGGMILMSLAMLPDVMENDFALNGIRRDGIYSSIYAIIEKAGFAIGAAVSGLYLSYAGYVSTTKGQLVQQSDGAVAALYAGNAVIPAVLLSLSFIAMCFYRLDRKTVQSHYAAAAVVEPE
ncbi:MFS transporter [Sphingobium sufflavum]|uniref:MFS transporter n=1 Tax=Sphingobium sufflavum TaxID=1129547 RepID=UPI001F46BC5E|nr:MFS transporter [Sphingobium sufflavum]MCE7796479.1 MFS transporter [Sphingobium sufflavum]